MSPPCRRINDFFFFFQRNSYPVFTQIILTILLPPVNPEHTEFSVNLYAPANSVHAGGMISVSAEYWQFVHTRKLCPADAGMRSTRAILFFAGRKKRPPPGQQHSGYAIVSAMVSFRSFVITYFYKEKFSAGRSPASLGGMKLVLPRPGTCYFFIADCFILPPVFSARPAALLPRWSRSVRPRYT